MTQYIIKLSEKIAKIPNITLIGWSQNSEFFNFHFYYGSSLALEKVQNVVSHLIFATENLEKFGICDIRIHKKDLEAYLQHKKYRKTIIL